MQIDVNNSEKSKLKKKSTKFSSWKCGNCSSVLGEYDMWRGIRSKNKKTKKWNK